MGPVGVLLHKDCAPAPPPTHTHIHANTHTVSSVTEQCQFCIAVYTQSQDPGILGNHVMDGVQSHPTGLLEAGSRDEGKLYH